MAQLKSVLAPLQKTWRAATELLTRPDGGGPTAAFSFTRLIAAAGLSLALLQGCTSTHPLVENSQYLPVPKDFTCVAPSQLHTLFPELDTSFKQDFPGSERIFLEAGRIGTQICKSPSASDYLNPGLGDLMKEQHPNEGIAMAAYLPSYHVVLVENIPLQMDAFLHELLHSIQFGDQEKISNSSLLIAEKDTAKRKEMAQKMSVGVKAVQSLVLHDAGTMAMQSIMEYRRQQRAPDAEREDLLLDKNNPNVVPQLYRFLTEQIKTDSSLVKELGDERTMPSDRVLDMLMTEFVEKASAFYAMPTMRLLAEQVKTEQENAKQGKDTPRLQIDTEADRYALGEIPQIEFGPLTKESQFPQTRESINSLGEVLASALKSVVVLNQEGGKLGLDEKRSHLINIEKLTRRYTRHAEP